MELSNPTSSDNVPYNRYTICPTPDKEAPRKNENSEESIGERSKNAPDVMAEASTLLVYPKVQKFFKLLLDSGKLTNSLTGLQNFPLISTCKNEPIPSINIEPIPSNTPLFKSPTNSPSVLNFPGKTLSDPPSVSACLTLPSLPQVPQDVETQSFVMALNQTCSD